MKNLLLTILTSVMMFTACQNTEELIDNSIKESPKESAKPHRVTLAKALKSDENGKYIEDSGHM